MSKFSESLPVAEERTPSVKIEVGGNYYCQTCPGDVDFAFYLPEKHILTWKCSAGHISLIEEFTL